MRGALPRAASRARAACASSRGFSGSRSVVSQAAALSPDEVGALRAKRFALLAGGGVLSAAAYTLWPRPPPPRDPHAGGDAHLSNWHAPR
jgi:hypothetical protein